MAELKLSEVCYQYKNSKQKVLKGISCDFQGGKLCAIVGPSGSGKTTLLSILAGLDRPSEGKVYINGDDLTTLDLDAYRRERVAMIFQSFQLFPLLTILENVSYPMENNGIPKKEARERAGKLLLMLGITEEKHKRFPSKLSGGEQQRVAIARALATGAKVLLADEPTGNLDRENTLHILDILKKFAHEEGYCVIVVTHDQEVASISDRVWRMQDGILTI
ncbi:ABC transporter ATP-binding protein [Anaerocolumna aminovalerica]|jgi:ABC-type lipoprotein export system ATPase subunit|uniref:Putative ABC transport system ATP-binding protein n=1 Tax=Anaerocolumna aminovalerica TaxID=1527 RepID=A0A1I5BJ05_9FIRM|nr:ABC transporter ATP-binding protein [Anaerocolumna aminovalerica]MBU5334476.1 ABC transporter ATP-binding protein [Anaerocolumna aminovalerica]MDU6265752.1 ABC transporter ATP-binding protein [Anaerocolumna aminovalerica]SFN74630.1 putative ABC transport system ATP-binding protein [Anaerocolumna aminovalerica]